MRFYILGLGPIGCLLAHHLRSVLPRTHPITLIYKSAKQAWVPKNAAATITIENKGVRQSTDGFDIEVLDRHSGTGGGVRFNPQLSREESAVFTPSDEDLRDRAYRSIIHSDKSAQYCSCPLTLGSPPYLSQYDRANCRSCILWDPCLLSRFVNESDWVRAWKNGAQVMREEAANGSESEDVKTHVLLTLVPADSSTGAG